MTLAEKFNARKPSKVSADQLRVNTGDFHYTFNFLSRTVETYEGGHGHHTPIPFSQFDREVLEIAYDKLKELGGDPAPLPAVAPPEPKKPDGLNL